MRNTNLISVLLLPLLFSLTACIPPGKDLHPDEPLRSPFGKRVDSSSEDPELLQSLNNSSREQEIMQISAEISRLQADSYLAANIAVDSSMHMLAKELLEASKLIHALTHDERFHAELLRLGVELVVVSDETSLAMEEGRRQLKIDMSSDLENVIQALSFESTAELSNSETKKLRAEIRLNRNLYFLNADESTHMLGLRLLKELRQEPRFVELLDLLKVSTIYLAEETKLEKKGRTNALHIASHSSAEELKEALETLVKE